MDIFMDNSWLHVWEYKKTRSAFLFKRSLEYNVRSLLDMFLLDHVSLIQRASIYGSEPDFDNHQWVKHIDNHFYAAYNAWYKYRFVY